MTKNDFLKVMLLSEEGIDKKLVECGLRPELFVDLNAKRYAINQERQAKAPALKCMIDGDKICPSSPYGICMFGHPCPIDITQT